jgi:hypothetical protein
MRCLACVPNDVGFAYVHQVGRLHHAHSSDMQTTALHKFKNCSRSRFQWTAGQSGLIHL